MIVTIALVLLFLFETLLGRVSELIWRERRILPRAVESYVHVGKKSTFVGKCRPVESVTRGNQIVTDRNGWRQSASVQFASLLFDVFSLSW